jgi:hypothetical protein
MHRYIGLPAIGMPKNLMASALPKLYETGPEEFRQDLTG